MIEDLFGQQREYPKLKINIFSSFNSAADRGMKIKLKEVKKTSY